MSDYRDPTNPRDPRRPDLGEAYSSWSAATWAWIGGIALAVIIVVLIFAGTGGDRTAQRDMQPPATTGQQPATPPAKGPTSPTPAPTPAPGPAK
jgi:hypothetical protein